MKERLRLLKKRQGTTLVEMMVCLLLISIMMTMAAGTLSAASRIFVRLQRQQYAQSILDTTMTELRDLTQNTAAYVKIYKNEEDILDKTGNYSGNALEYMNEQGYVVLVSTDGCTNTDIYIKDKKINTEEAVGKGRLLIRYYSRNTDGTYICRRGTQAVARAMTKAFGEGFYMKNYLDVTYSIPGNRSEGDTVSTITATVTLYSDENRTQVIATDSEVLNFRYPVVYKTAVTATSASPAGSND